jgi:hypothetical protein
MAYTKYSLTPANNTAAPPDGAPEGMLPSAVNDTMRDMMAQIRDCGDGVRDGTYTMTAVKITGGTINGATIGATTATTGKFTTLTNSALTSGRITYAGASGLLSDTDGLTYDGTIFQVKLGNTATTQFRIAHSSAANFYADYTEKGDLTVGRSSWSSNVTTEFSTTSSSSTYTGDVAGGFSFKPRGSLAVTINGNGVLDIGTGAGAVGQIQFPATQVASANANTLDDYEEGTWTPTITLNSGTATTYTIATGTYTKTGRMVVVLGSITPTNGTLGSTNGYIRMTGLPFTVGTRNGVGSGANVSNLNNGVSTTMAYSTTVDVAFASGVTSANEYPFVVTYFV